MDDASERARIQLHEIFRDADGNGIPDILEGKLRGEDLRNLVSSQSNTVKVFVGGKEYSNLNELPSDKRQQIEHSLDQLARISTQAGNVLKGFGLFKLIKWFTKKKGADSQRLYTTASTPQNPPSYQVDERSFFAKSLPFLLGAVIVGALAYYLFGK